MELRAEKRFVIIYVQLVVEVIGMGEITHDMRNNFYLSDPAPHTLEHLALRAGTTPSTCTVLDHRLYEQNNPPGNRGNNFLSLSLNCKVTSTFNKILEVFVSFKK